MRRRWKWLGAFAVGVLTLAGVAIPVLRALRSRVSDPVPVEPGLVHIRAGWPPVSLFGARVGSQVLLFDTGPDPRGTAVDALLRALAGTRADVTHVFLTHGHPDHVAGLNVLPNARIHAGAADVPLIAGQAPCGPWMARLLCAVLSVPGARVTDPLRGEVEIPLGGGESVHAVPVPGHTPGSYAYLFQGILFAGDSLNVDGKGLTPANRLLTVDPAENRRALALLQTTVAGRVTTVCAGHGGCTGDASAALETLARDLKQ